MALRFLNSGYFAGKVGIGIETPTSTLHVAGPSTLATQGTVLKIENTADQGSSQDIHIYNQYDRDIGIKFETLGGTNYIWQDSNSDDALILSSGGNNRTNDSTLILKQDHNVLIPNGSLLINATTKAFNDKFYINSDAYATGGWRVGTAATYVGKLINDGGKLTLMSDGSRDVQIGNNNNPSILYVDTSEEKVGIGITTPTSKLHINQSVTNPDLDLPASFAVEIDSNHSGSAATTGDREQGGLYIDVDSSTTGGDTADEHRLYGINNNVNHTGDADLAYAISNRVEQNTTAGTTTNVIGSYSAAISDGGSGAVLTNITGVYGSVDMQDATPVSNSYGGQFLNNTNANRTGATINSYGIRSEIQIGSTSAYTSLYAGHFSIDSNAAYTASNSYLLYLDYAGASLATNTYAIYSGDDVKSYHAGSFGIGTTTPDYKLDVEGSVNNADIAIRINNTFDDNDPASEPNAALFLNAASNNGYLRVHGAPDNTAAKHQIDLGSTAGSSFLTFSPGDAERMRIDTDGNVGINTTSPDFKLDVDGTFGVSDLPFNTDSVSVLVADETIASEIITNGDFDTDLTDWTNSSSYPWTSATWTSSGVRLQTSGSAQYKSFYQDIGPITSGKTYKISYSAVKTSGTMRVGVETSPVGSSVGYGKSLTSSEVVSEIFTATATDATCVISFWGQNDSSTNEWVIDNVSIKEVTFASNQIQKRELGTGAFGPTPVGAYLPLAGGTMTGNTKHNDNVFSYWGNNDDLSIKHNGTDSFVENYTGHLNIVNYADGKDIKFWSDDGSGGIATYFFVDTLSDATQFTKNIYLQDNKKALFGNSSDLQIYHDGSNSFMVDAGTGDMLHYYSNDWKVIKYGTGELSIWATTDAGVKLYYDNVKKFETTSTGVTVTGNINVDSALISSQENTDIDSAASEVVAQVAHATYTAAFFDFVVKKGTNVRSGTVYACHDGDTTPLVEFTETSTNDLGDTSDVTLSVDISGANMRLVATVTSDDWSVKSLIRAI